MLCYLQTMLTIKLLISTIVTKWKFVIGIIGGESIAIEEAPYQLNYGDQCGAVLVHRQWALTTAHCGEYPYVRIGSKYHLQGYKVYISAYLPHPRYGESHKFDFDIQLLKFFRQLQFGDRVNAIDIGQKVGKWIYKAGWGYKEEKGDYQTILQRARVNTVRMEHCQAVNNSWYNHTLTGTMMCAGGWGVDACQGDSGGGAISFGKLVGLSSFGFGCGRQIPGVYTKLSNFYIRNWIRLHTGV